MQRGNKIKQLIENAAALAGGEGKLAKVLGVPAQHVTNWKNSDRTCMPEDQTRIAHLGGNNALETLIESTIERNAGTLRGDQLKQALGK